MSASAEPSRQGSPPGPLSCDLEGCQLSASFRKGRRHYCTPQHWRIHAEKLAALPRCPTCRQQFGQPSSQPGRVGRRPTYCSDECKRAREREIATAVRELGRDVVTGVDLVELLDRSRLLWSVWYGRNGDDWVERFWFGNVPRRTGDVPDDRVKRALRDRIDRLYAMVSTADRQRRKEQAREADRATEERLRKARDAARVEENAWRGTAPFVEGAES
jgi:hypothetical protein